MGEACVDAILRLLMAKGLLTLDELRRAIEEVSALAPMTS